MNLWRRALKLWNDYQAGRRRRRAAISERMRREYLAYNQRQQALASGAVALPRGWRRNPSDPPELERWWDGRWTEHTRESSTARRVRIHNDAAGLVSAGWITFAIGLLAWPLFLATLILGIIVVARGITGQGVILIAAALFGPVISLIGVAAVIGSSL